MKRALLTVTTLLALLLPLAAVGEVADAAASSAPGAERVAARGKLPTKAQWQRTVRKRMLGSGSFLRAAVANAQPGEKLAINLDIDNSIMATFYAHGTAMKPSYDLVGKARRWGVAVLINTGRSTEDEAKARHYLRRGGYRGDHAFDEICMRRPGERVQHSKQRCRAQYVAAGYHLVLNVGNNATDFVGGDYDKAYRLPNYNARLS